MNYKVFVSQKSGEIKQIRLFDCAGYSNPEDAMQRGQREFAREFDSINGAQMMIQAIEIEKGVLNAEHLSMVCDDFIEALIIESEKFRLSEINPFYENQKNLVTLIHTKKGLDYLFQDEETGAVLKTDTKEFTSVSLFNLTISRTRFSDDEAKQSLSNKEAEEKGFILKFGDRRKKKENVK